MKLGLMYTGGTIGCFYKPLKPMTYEEFGTLFHMKMLPVLRSECRNLDIGHLPFGPPQLDSTNLVPLDWCTIVETILPVYSDYDAFLILHGTDTMAYSAAALTFLFMGLNKEGDRDAIVNKPIILTGSQVPLFDGEEPEGAQVRFNTDAFQNVCGAVKVAYYGMAKVSLFFNHQLFLGSRCQKTSSNQFDAFSSPNYPPLAQLGTGSSLNHGKIRGLFPSKNLLIGASEDAMARLQEQAGFMKEHMSKIRIGAFEAYPGDPERLAQQLESMLHLDDPERQLDGLILDAYGAGNFPSGNSEDATKGAVFRVLKEASEKGVVIVNNTTCLSGMVDSSTYAAGSWLADVNAISAYDMTSHALYTKLLYVLTLAKRYGWDKDMVNRMLSTNLAGEMVDVHCLDTYGQRELWPGESITSRDGTARLTNDVFAGPQLSLMDESTGEWGNPVWSAVNNQRVGLTCILRMQADGNLVLRNNKLDKLWDSCTSCNLGEEPFSRLELVGKTDPRGVSLFVYNYVANVVTKHLYPPQS